MRIDIYIATQTLDLLDAQGQLLRRYRISSAEKGCGERKGSYQTPRGHHIIRARIGAGQPCCAVFRARRPTGEIWSEALHAAHPGRDWILSRILWLSGLEAGVNRLGDVDTMQRYIYIHGTPENVVFGPPTSHGCIRMHNHDLLDLFDRVTVGTPVTIHAEGFNCSGTGDTLRYEEVRWCDAAAELSAVRDAVFVQEQGVPPELEIDEQDPLSRHWLARAPSGRVVGTVRLTPDLHIGRLAVAADWRRQGAGQHLLTMAMDAARASGAAEVALNAQTHALGFYARLGFQAQGEVFDDAGIPHRLMICQLH